MSSSLEVLDGIMVLLFSQPRANLLHFAPSPPPFSPLHEFLFLSSQQKSRPLQVKPHVAARRDVTLVSLTLVMATRLVIVLRQLARRHLAVARCLHAATLALFSLILLLLLHPSSRRLKFHPRRPGMTPRLLRGEVICANSRSQPKGAAKRMTRMLLRLLLHHLVAGNRATNQLLKRESSSLPSPKPRPTTTRKEPSPPTAEREPAHAGFPQRAFSAKVPIIWVEEGALSRDANNCASQ